jgi:hypothetical protein
MDDASADWHWPNEAKFKTVRTSGKVTEPMWDKRVESTGCPPEEQWR